MGTETPRLMASKCITRSPARGWGVSSSPGRRQPDGNVPSCRKASIWEAEILDFAQDPGEAALLALAFPFSTLDSLDLFFIFSQEKLKNTEDFWGEEGLGAKRRREEDEDKRNRG